MNFVQESDHNECLNCPETQTAFTSQSSDPVLHQSVSKIKQNIQAFKFSILKLKSKYIVYGDNYFINIDYPVMI